jgi:microcystin-dependent protein
MKTVIFQSKKQKKNNMPQTNLNLSSAVVDIPDNSISESKLDFTIDKFPSGTITMFSGSTAPDGWLICSGDQLPNGTGTVQGKTADFSALYAIVSSNYDAAGRLPDCRGIFVRGAGSQTVSGKSFSAALGNKATDKTIQHTHGVSGSITTTSTASYFNVSSNDRPVKSKATVGVVNNFNEGTGTSINVLTNTVGSVPSSWPDAAPPGITSTSTHTLSTINQTNGQAETAPAAIVLNYIIKI